MLRVTLSALAIVLAFNTAASAAPSASSEAQSIAQFERGLITAVSIAGQTPAKMTIQSRLHYYHIPALSIAFFDASGVRWARAYGASTHTLFQAGSISKPVSAVGILHLVDGGRLKLDENVNDKLISWKVPENEFTAKTRVTLRELLSHTAGTTVRGFDGYERGKRVPTLQQVLNGMKPANSPPIRVNARPGTRYRYSGGGYVIAEQLLIDTQHDSFATYMHDSVLAPLGMTDSTFEQPLPQAEWHRAAVATDETGKPYPGGWNVYPEQAAAGLWTTPTDLAKFAIGVQRAIDGAKGAILSQAIAREMLTPVKPGYGLGFALAGAAATSTFFHDGANDGFQAFFVMHRGGEGVAIMTDSDNGDLLINEVLNGISAVYGWSDFSPQQKKLFAMNPKEYSRFVGVYDFGFGLKVTVERRYGALYSIADRRIWHRLYPRSVTTFFMLEENVDITFTSNASGAIDGLMLYGHKGKKIT